MLNFISKIYKLTLWNVASIYTTPVKLANRLETAKFLMTKEEIAREEAMRSTIPVAWKSKMTVLGDLPKSVICTRKARIYKPAKNVMQSGTDNIHLWRVSFDTTKRWESPLSGYTSAGDPLAFTFLNFRCIEDAIAHCERYGWRWYIDPKFLCKAVKPKSYASLFSWNKRMRASTK